MTTLANFDLQNDLKVEFYLPDEASNLFIIGISKIGGDDVLAGAGLFIIGLSDIGSTDVLGDNEYVAFTWQDLNCVVGAAEISIGGDVQDSLFFQPRPASADITIQSFEYDHSYNAAFRPGTPVRVRLARGATEKVLFSGFIDTISGTYYQDGVNKLDISAFDSFKRYVNTRITLDTESDFIDYVTPLEQLETIALELGTSMNSSSEAADGEIPLQFSEDIIANTPIYDAIQVGLGLLWVDQATQELVFIPRPVLSTPPTGTPVIGNHHEDPYHLCMTNITTDSTLDKVFNSLRVELKSDTNTYVVVNDQDTIDLYGVFALDVILNTTDIDELQRWALAVFNKSPTNLVSSVETKTLDRLGTLTEAAFFDPGQPIGVHYTEGVLDIDDYYTVTKVVHSIDPDNWFTTLELWKEA